MSSHRLFSTATLFFILSLLSGCSVFRPVGTAISDGYENTVAYFNSYYNASSLFNEAEDEILAAEEKQRAATGFADHRIEAPAGARTKLSAVIDKCSNILSFQPGSALVDDALLLIGKSYFYQGEFLKSERKFSELLSFAPDGPLAMEASLWKVKALFELKNEELGLPETQALIQKAVESGEEEIAGEANLILGHLFSRRGDPQEAIAAYQESVRLSRDGTIQATGQFRVGDERMKLGEYSLATDAFLLAGEYSDEPGLFLAAHHMAVRAQRDAGAYDKALEISQNLAEDYRFTNNEKAISFEIALTLRAQGNTPEAARLFTYLDTTENRTELGAKAAFELGVIHEEIGEYKKAQVAYTRATMFPVPSIYARARNKATAFSRYLILKSQRAERDTLLWNLDSAVTDSIPALGNLDSLLAMQAVNAFDIGEIFYSDLEKLDSAKVWYRNALENLRDNERTPRILFILAELSDEEAGSLYEEIISSYPRSHYAVRAKMKLGLHEEAVATDSASTAYRTAEENIESGDYQNAVRHLKGVVSTYPQSPFAAKSTYALGWLYEHRLHHPDSALVFYRNLIEHFGNSEYAVAVRRRVQPESAAPDSLNAPQERPRELDERRREDPKTQDKPARDKPLRDKKEIIE